MLGIRHSKDPSRMTNHRGSGLGVLPEFVMVVLSSDQ